MSKFPPLLSPPLDMTTGSPHLRIAKPPKLTVCCLDYCIVAFFIIFVISTIQWFIDGRKNFTGPKLDLAALQNGEVVGMAPDLSISSTATVSGEEETQKKVAV
jgi:choline transport protein